MSIMDFFASQETAVPSTGSSGGNWKDWFLDMKGRKPFGRTAYPDPDAERGDWIDWYLNREGPAGKFRGSKRPRYGINYLFNGGGSVQSGPRTRQKLQQRTPSALGNVTDRYYREGNVEGMKNINQELQNRIKNHPVLQPGTGQLRPNIHEPWNNPGPGSFWNAGLQPGDDTGIMSAAMTDYSPDAKGRWLTESPTGNKLLSYLANQFGSEGSSEYLEDAIGGGGFPVLGGYVRPTWGDGSYGIEGNWKFGG